jgi:poly(3-hydroxybutyrate) depolymerase
VGGLRHASGIDLAPLGAPQPMSDEVREWPIRYLAHNRTARAATIVLPAEYGPGKPTPRLPLVISPHGRASGGRFNARLWDTLPGRGRFGVISPDGMGRRLPYVSWGYRGQIDDLARMPSIAEGALPWLRIDDDRIYAVGGSMGGQETLLLLGQHPKLLAGAVSIDGVTNFYRRYYDFALSFRTKGLQALARFEVGGTPSTNTAGYVLRSPTHWIPQIAESGVALQVWWSIADLIVEDQIHQSAHFFNEVKKLRRRGRLESVTGNWDHMSQMRERKIPEAAEWLGLLP